MKTNNLLTTRYIEKHPEDVSRLLEQLSAKEAAAFFESVNKKQSSVLAERMLPQYFAKTLDVLDTTTAREILSEMDAHALARVLRLRSADSRERLVEGLPDAGKARVSALLRRPESDAGSLMDKDMFLLSADLTVGEAIKQIERLKEPVPGELYVVDRSLRLKGVTRPGDLFKHKKTAPLGSAISKKLWAVQERSNIHSLVSHHAWQTFYMMPVVSGDGEVVGILRRDKVLVAYKEGSYQRQTETLMDMVVTLAGVYWLSMAEALESALNIDAKTSPKGKEKRDA